MAKSTKLNDSSPKNFTESPKYLEGKQLLPEDLWPVYEQLVDEYAFFALRRTGRSWAAYKVLADLILSGWRPSGVQTKDSL